MKTSQSTQGIIFALISYALFVTGDSFYKYLGAMYSVYEMAFYGKLAASILFLFYIAIKRQKIITYFPKLQLYRSIAFTITSLCIYYSYKHMTLADVALLFYLCPFIIALLSRFILKEKVGTHRIISIITGFTGVLIIIRPGFIEPNPAMITMLIAIFCYSYSAILSRQMGPKEPAINFALFPAIMTFICAIPLLGGMPKILPATDLALMTMGGTIGGIAILLVSVAYVKTHAVTVSILAYTDMFWALLLGYLIFGDVTNDPFTILGGVIIILSGIYLIYRENKVNKENYQAD